MALIGVLLTGQSVTAKVKGPVKVFILAGQSNMEGHGRIQGEQKGTLETLSKDTATAARYKHLLDADGKWIARDDVYLYYYSPRGKLTIGNSAAKNAIGPELAFGWVVGDYLEDPVLLIKWGPGGTSLAGPWRPPSSGKHRDTPRGEKGVGSQYDTMINGTKEALAALSTHFPALAGKRYELAGFGWHQGWNDGCSAADVREYETNMAHLIRDVRKDLGVPDLPVVIAAAALAVGDRRLTGVSA